MSASARRHSTKSCQIDPCLLIYSRAAKQGGFKRGGFPIWACPSFLSFALFGTFPIFSGFSDLSGDSSRIFPIYPFPLSRPINITAPGSEEQSRKGLRHNLDLSRKKWETPGLENPPPGLASPNMHAVLQSLCSILGEAQSTRTAKFDPTSGSTSVPSGPTRAPTRVPTRAHESAHERSFRCFSPLRTSHERPHETSHEGVHGSAHESVHESGQFSHVLFSHVLFVVLYLLGTQKAYSCIT